MNTWKLQIIEIDPGLLLIATQQPMASDLRRRSAVLHLVTDLERMGDYAAGNARICIIIGNEAHIKPLTDIPRMNSPSVSHLPILILTARDEEIDVTRAGQPLQLKRREFDLLGYFVRHAGQVLSRDRLLRNVWGYDDAGDTRTVDVHVRWLRIKIELDPTAPKRLQSARGIGYVFAA